ncbi:hypothetical protein ACI8AA_23110 [Geodermatophilus sp. SYSU D01180]
MQSDDAASSTPRGRARAFVVERAAGRQVARLIDGGVARDDIEPRDVLDLLRVRGASGDGWSRATYFRRRAEVTKEQLERWGWTHAPYSMARASLQEPLTETDEDRLFQCFSDELLRATFAGPAIVMAELKAIAAIHERHGRTSAAALIRGFVRLIEADADESEEWAADARFYPTSLLVDVVTAASALPDGSARWRRRLLKSPNDWLGADTEDSRVRLGRLLTATLTGLAAAGQVAAAEQASRDMQAIDTARLVVPAVTPKPPWPLFYAPWRDLHLLQMKGPALEPWAAAVFEWVVAELEIGLLEGVSPRPPTLKTYLRSGRWILNESEPRRWTASAGWSPRQWNALRARGLALCLQVLKEPAETLPALWTRLPRSTEDWGERQTERAEVLAALPPESLAALGEVPHMAAVIGDALSGTRDVTASWLVPHARRDQWLTVAHRLAQPVAVATTAGDVGRATGAATRAQRNLRELARELAAGATLDEKTASALRSAMVQVAQNMSA